MLEENQIQFQYKARYFSSAQAGPQIERVLVVFHGYGMLAYYFLQKFRELFDEKTLVIAPEGLNRFYLEGFSGRVGATWMTKEDRLSDIENYLAYLAAIKRGVLDQCPHAEITLLGFSQGAATVSRWIMQGDVKWHRLILWAGLWPPDLPFDLGKDKLGNDKEIHFVYGNQDPFLKEQHLQSLEDLSTKLGVQPAIQVFEGGHEMNMTVLNKLL